MNRHSRVHLAQKRKQMEESSTGNNSSSADFTVSSSSSSTQNVSASCSSALMNNSNQGVNLAGSVNSSSSSSAAVVSNDRSKSYCKDCDIQFSSIKTYEHHRNNYCQKYKTIEAVVPVEVSSSSNNSASNPTVNSNR